MPQSEAWIEDLAGAILDGASIDWASAESSADFAERPLLNELRLLATVADLHRLPRSLQRISVVTPKEETLSQKGPAILDGKYLLEGHLGQGGMGFVYRARHLELGRTFAVKLVQPNKSHRPEYLARFRIEAQVLGRLNHPNIVQVTDFGVDSRAGPYLVMEYIEGITLGAYLTRHKRALLLDEALPIFSSIARALDYAHESGILHRDLKPSNILLFPPEADQHHLRILDFGIARFLDEPGGRAAVRDSLPPEPSSGELTATGTVLGTLEYIAPEIFNGQQPSASVDIYAFGILIYEVLTGQRPFSGSVQELQNLHLHRTPAKPSVVCSSLPKELDDAILRPLNKDPASRPSAAREIVSELRKAYRQATVRHWRQRELPKRAALSVVVVMLVPLLFPLLQQLPVIRTLENQLADLRIGLQPLRAPDPRIVLISIDEATLSSDPRPLPEKADEAGILLGRFFAAGAQAVAIDLLLPEQWSRSEFFSQLILDHSKNMVLASYSNPQGGVQGPESVKGLITVALGREKVERLFGFVNLSADPDGVVRTMPLMYQDQRGRTAYSFAARTAEIVMAPSSVEGVSGTRLWIDYSVDWSKFHRIAWKDASNVLARSPEAFRDRVILVGGEFAGSGDVYSAVPSASALPREMSGLVLQALALNTLLEGRRIETPNETLLVAFLAVVLGAAVMARLSHTGSGWTMGTLAVTGVFYIVFSFLHFRWNRQLWPIVAPAVAFGLAIICATLLRHKLLPFPNAATEGNGI